MKRYTFFLLWSLCLLAYANSLAINPVKPTKDKGGDKPVASKLVSSKSSDKKKPKVEEVKPLLPKKTWANLPTSFDTKKITERSIGPDLFMFTATASKDSIAVGEEFELTVRVDWVDFGNGSAITFLPQWYKYALKVVMPEGFIQTGGNYKDFCSEPVNAENPRATFTIRGKFEHAPEKSVFTILRGFEGADEKSAFILKGEKEVLVYSAKNQHIHEHIQHTPNARIASTTVAPLNLELSSFSNTSLECIGNNKYKAHFSILITNKGASKETIEYVSCYTNNSIGATHETFEINPGEQKTIEWDEEITENRYYEAHFFKYVEGNFDASKPSTWSISSTDFKIYTTSNYLSLIPSSKHTLTYTGLYDKKINDVFQMSAICATGYSVDTWEFDNKHVKDNTSSNNESKEFKVITSSNTVTYITVTCKSVGANSCSEKKQLSLRLNYTPPTPTCIKSLSPNISYDCTTKILTASGITESGFSYEWYEAVVGDGNRYDYILKKIGKDAITFKPEITDTKTHYYSLSVTGNKDGCSYYGTYRYLAINQKPIVEDIVTTCTNTASFSLQGCAIGYNIQKDGSTLKQYQYAGSTPKVTYTDSDFKKSSTYTISCESNKCLDETTTVSITSNDIPTDTFIYPSLPILYGSDVILTSSCPSGATIEWYDSKKTKLSSSNSYKTKVNKTETYYYKCPTTCDDNIKQAVITVAAAEPVITRSGGNPIRKNESQSDYYCAGSAVILKATCPTDNKASWVIGNNIYNQDTITAYANNDLTYYAKCSINGISSSGLTYYEFNAIELDKPYGETVSPTTITSGVSTPINFGGTCDYGSLVWKKSDSQNWSKSLSTSINAATTFDFACQSQEGCLSSLGNSKSVSIYGGVTVSATSTKTSSCDANDGKITATASGGTGSGYQYKLFRNDGTTVLTEYSSSSSFNNLPAGVYYIKAKDSNQAESAPQAVTVEAPSGPSIPQNVVANPSTIKKGESSTLTASCSTGTVTWYDDKYDEITNTTVSPNATTTYKVACVDGTCKSNYATVTITVTGTVKPSDPTNVTSNTSICAGTAIQLSANCSSDATIVWYTNSGLSNVLGNTNVTPTSSSNYYVVCQKEGVSSNPKSVEITVNAASAPTISPSIAEVTSVSPTVQLTSSGCAGGEIRWFNSAGNLIGTGTTYTASTGSYVAKCVLTCGNGSTSVATSETKQVTYREICTTVGISPILVNDTKPNGYPTTRIYISGTINLHVEGCKDNNRAKWYNAQGAYLGQSATYSETISSNATFAVSCEDHCDPSKTVGFTSINFVVDNNVDPQLINETAGGKSEFCGVGQLTVRASGCPDPNKVRWWVGNATEVGASYTAIITTTTEARFQCIHPVTGQLIGNQKYMTFNVKTYTQCNYAASIINNTPGEKRAFCKKGWIDLTVSGCPNNNLVEWYASGTELIGGTFPNLKGTITRTSTFGVNCINPNDNSKFGFNSITFVVDNSGCNSSTPTIINNTTNQSNKFCQKGWVNLEVDGCTDNSKAKWYKNDVLTSITAIYREVINTTANYKVICDGATLTNPYYAEITMEVMTHSTCDLPSAINLTPNNQTDFCGSGNLKLMMTGCNTQQRGVAYEGHYDDGTLTGNAAGMINGSWEIIDGVSQYVLNYNVVKSGYFKVYCKDDNNNIRYNTEQRVYFKVNPIPSVTASNIPACVNSRFMLTAQIPTNPSNTGNILFEWKNTTTGTSVGTLQNTSLIATDITPTDYTVTFTDNKGCVASDHTTVTNLANPIISIPISTVEACQDKPITFTSSTSGAGVVKTITVNVPSRETEPSSTNTLPRSGVILVTNGSGELLSSINISQKGITYSTTCVKCGNISLTDGMIVGYRNGDKPAKIKIINGCAKLVWPDLNDDLVHSDWVSQMTGKTLSDATILSCLTLANVNNCSANTQSCVVVENTSSLSNIAATGGSGTFTFSTPTTGGTWTIAAPSWITLSETSGGVDNIYQWTKGTSQTNLSSRATLTIANVTPTDAGIYTVQITDAKNCKASTNVSLTIRNKPTISPLSNSPENGSTQIGVGEDLIVSVLENYPSYKWQFNSESTVLGTTQELVRANSTEDYSGTYKVSVEDQYGCPNSNTIRVAIKPFECKLTATATPYCYIQNNKRWAKVDITVKNRTLHWSGILTIQRVKDLDGNEVQDPILYTNTWQNANTTQIALPTQDKILDGIYKISIAEKRSDQESGEGVECYPEDIFITVGCQRQCKKLQPCLTGDCCGIPANIDLNQEIKLETLAIDDVVKANDFDLIITKVSVANAANYSWNIEAISKVPVFDNVFIGLKSTTPVVFNECKELVSGQIETLYNPANWDKPIQGKAIAKALYESAKEVLEALTSNPDVKVDMTQQDLANVAEQLREQAAKDLPKDLELKANEAIRKMEEARDEYAKAKAAGDSAGMAAATTKFNDAKAELATVKTETEKYLNLYQRIVQLTLDRMWTRFGSIPTPPVPAVESTEEQAIGESIPISQMTWLSEAEKTAIINNFKTKAEDNLKLTFKFFVERHTNNATAIKDLEKKVLVYDKDGASTIEVVSPTQKLSEYIYATMCKTCTGTGADPMETKMVNTTERAFSKRIKEIFKNLYTKE